MKTGDELVALLGKSADDPEVLEALADLEIRWPPELEETDDPDEAPDWYVWRPSSKHGFEFGFQDEAHLRARDADLRGKGPLVLSQVYFYGEHEDVQPFQGVLPFGLTLADARAAAAAKLVTLGAPRAHRRDVWDPPAHRVVIEHVPGRDVLDSVLVKLRLTDWPAVVDPPPPLPTLDELIALFGQPWYAPEMRRRLFPLGLDKCGPDIAIHRYADLRRDWGLELYFFRDRARTDDNPLKNKGAGFTGVKLYGPRYQDARGWTGALPFGLQLAEAYPSILRKVGRPPNEASEGKLSGFALWHLPDYTLHVLFDTVDNVISCVSIFQPGAWQTVP